jgi:rhodanese-related sulfurtransferase
MKTYAFAILAGLVVAGTLALAVACEPKDDCASGVCMPKTDAAAPVKAETEAAVAVEAKEKPEINTAVLATLIRSGDAMVILDARTGKYDDGRRVAGAKALSPEAGAEEAAKLIATKDSLVVTYCANLKCPASGKLAAHLRELGYRNVLEYPYGIEGWVAAGQQVDKAK